MLRFRVTRHSRYSTILRIAGLAALVALPPLAVIIHGAFRMDACLDDGGCFDHAEWTCHFGDEALCDGPMTFFPPRHRWLALASGAAWLVGAGAILLGRRRDWPH
jgi:hypothetical protein